jgi:tetratricopeptide (TPR) repeat protein
MNRGNAYSEKGDKTRALADYTRAIELDRNFIEAYVNRGTTYITLKQYDLAIADFDRAIGIWSGYAPAWLWRGEAYFLKGETQRAIADFDRAVKLRPEWASALVRACWARAVLNTELERALNLCTRAIAAKKTDRAFNNRGFVHFRMGRYREAIADYDAALALDDSAGSLFMRGVCKLRLGDASGHADIARARALQPTVLEEHAAMGVAL